MRIPGLLVAAGLALAASAPLSAQSSATLTPPTAEWTGPRTSDGQPDVHGSYAKDWIGARGPNFDPRKDRIPKRCVQRVASRKTSRNRRWSEPLMAASPINRGRASNASRTARTSSTRRSSGTSTPTRAACRWDYDVTSHDPRVFSQPWTAHAEFRKNTANVDEPWESACYEGERDTQHIFPGKTPPK